MRKSSSSGKSKKRKQSTLNKMKQLPPLPQEVTDRILSTLDKVDQISRPKAADIMGIVRGFDVLIAAETYGYIRYYSVIQYGVQCVFVCKAENWRNHYKEPRARAYCYKLINYIIEESGMILMSDLCTLINPRVNRLAYNLNDENIRSIKAVYGNVSKRLILSEKLWNDYQNGILPPGVKVANKTKTPRPKKPKAEWVPKKQAEDMSKQLEHNAMRIFLERFPEMLTELNKYQCAYIIKRYEHYIADDFTGMDKHARICGRIDKLCRMLGWNQRTHKPKARPVIVSTERVRHGI